MIKKKNNKKNLFLLLSLIIIIDLLISTIMYLDIRKFNQVKYLEVFGNKIELISGKKVYRVFLDEASIKKVNGKCQVPIEAEFTNGKGRIIGISYYADGDTHAYFFINSQSKNKDKQKEEILSSADDIQTYDLYVEVFLRKPLEISKECQK